MSLYDKNFNLKIKKNNANNLHSHTLPLLIDD